MNAARLLAAIRREIRLSQIWLTSSLAWSLATGALFILYCLGDH